MGRNTGCHKSGPGYFPQRRARGRVSMKGRPGEQGTRPEVDASRRGGDGVSGKGWGLQNTRTRERMSPHLGRGDRRCPLGPQGEVGGRESTSRKDFNVVTEAKRSLQGFKKGKEVKGGVYLDQRQKSLRAETSLRANINAKESAPGLSQRHLNLLDRRGECGDVKVRGNPTLQYWEWRQRDTGLR